MTVDATIIGGVDDAIELSEFVVRIYGPNAPEGPIEFNEVGPIANFDIPRIIREYGSNPKKVKRLSSKINFEPCKFVSYYQISDPRLRALIDQGRPRRGIPGSPQFDIQVNFLDRAGNELFGVKMKKGIIYNTAGITLNASSQDQPAKLEFMYDYEDWDWTDIGQ
jgi:hypothetical protein